MQSSSTVKFCSECKKSRHIADFATISGGQIRRTCGRHLQARRARNIRLQQKDTVQSPHLTAWTGFIAEVIAHSSSERLDASASIPLDHLPVNFGDFALIAWKYRALPDNARPLDWNKDGFETELRALRIALRAVVDAIMESSGFKFK